MCLLVCLSLSVLFILKIVNDKICLVSVVFYCTLTISCKILLFFLTGALRAAKMIYKRKAQKIQPVTIKVELWLGFILIL